MARGGKLEGEVVRVNGDVLTSDKSLRSPFHLLSLFESFLKFRPQPARRKATRGEQSELCKLLRFEVVERLR
jgi:hypothetical protein